MQRFSTTTLIRIITYSWLGPFIRIYIVQTLLLKSLPSFFRNCLLLLPSRVIRNLLHRFYKLSQYQIVIWTPSPFILRTIGICSIKSRVLVERRRAWVIIPFIFWSLIPITSSFSRFRPTSSSFSASSHSITNISIGLFYHRNSIYLCSLNY